MDVTIEKTVTVECKSCGRIYMDSVDHQGLECRKVTLSWCHKCLDSEAFPITLRYDKDGKRLDY